MILLAGDGLGGSREGDRGLGAGTEGLDGVSLG